MYPYLSEAQIENEAQRVLNQFQQQHGRINSYTTPIDEIVENMLGYRLEMNELEDDILGFINCNKKLIVINSSLDTFDNDAPHINGRYRFTLAHEAGHAVLHGHILLANHGNLDLWEKDEKCKILCRKSDSKVSVEWQANYFSGSLLMPRQKVIQAWRELGGQPDAIDDQSFIGQFAAMFEVSKQAATLRLKQPYIAGELIGQNEMMI